MSLVWPVIFSINITQSLFLISLILIKGTRNTFAARVIVILLIALMMSNIGDLVSSTGLADIVPRLFVLSFGAMWLFGPIFYLYSKAIVDPDFKWKHIYWLHFLPYGYQWYISSLLISQDQNFWTTFIEYFRDGRLPIRSIEKMTVALQIIQLTFYLVLTMRWVRKFSGQTARAQYIVPMPQRAKWLRTFAIGFALFLILVIVFYAIVILKGHHEPALNYGYTFVTSLIIFTLAYKMVLSPELLSPDFAQKYRTYKQFEGNEGTQYVDRIRELMESKRLFADPDLSLSVFAEQLGLPAHQVSKLVNEKFGRSFTDLVNEYRVEDFIKKMNDPKYKTFSLYGIALEAGFNSKSTFNTAFKKLKGKTPSEFKTEN